MPLSFFSEEIDFSLTNSSETITWLEQVCSDNHVQIGELNYIFCSDQYLLEINKKYLDHDYYTDIITFDHSDEEEIIEGDVFISIDRIKENSDTLKTDFNSELHRVIVHGMLHLIGFDDKSEEDKKLMREKEDAYLSLLKT